jgi:hypothetical protein
MLIGGSDLNGNDYAKFTNSVSNLNYYPLQMLKQFMHNKDK